MILRCNYTMANFVPSLGHCKNLGQRFLKSVYNGSKNGKDFINNKDTGATFETVGLVYLSCNLNMLDMLQKWVYRTVGPLLVASLQPLTCRNSANLSLFYRYYYGC